MQELTDIRNSSPDVDVEYPCGSRARNSGIPSPAQEREHPGLRLRSVVHFPLDRQGFWVDHRRFCPEYVRGITEYWPTMLETLITMGVWAIGFLLLTVLYKVAIAVREDDTAVEH